MTNDPKATIKVSDFLIAVREKLSSTDAAPSKNRPKWGTQLSDIKLTPEGDAAYNSTQSALRAILAKHMHSPETVDSEMVQMLYSTIRARAQKVEGDRKFRNVHDALIRVAGHIQTIGRSPSTRDKPQLEMNAEDFSMDFDDFADPTNANRKIALRTVVRDYPEGIPADIAAQVAGEHERVNLGLNTYKIVTDNSLLVRDSAKWIGEETGAGSFSPELLPATLDAFRAAVAAQFRTTPEYMKELNRMFESHKSGRTNVLCWTQYGIDHFKQFYTNYDLALKAGGDVEELLLRLEHASVSTGATEIEEGEADPVQRVRPAAEMPISYRKVPAPKPEEIEEGKLIGLANPVEGDDLSIADWNEDALIALIQESDAAIKSAAKQTVGADTLRISNTKAHITIPTGFTKYAEAEGWPAAVQAFKLAVLHEAGSRRAGESELAQMFTAYRAEKGAGVIFSWTPQGLHKFQIFLPRYVETMREEHPELAHRQSPETRINALGIDDGDFDGLRERVGGYGDRTGAVKRGILAGSSTAQDTARAIKIGFTGPKGHLSDTVYPYDPKNHFTLQQLTASISGRLGFKFTTNQISHRINRIIEDYAEQSRSTSRQLKQDIYVQMAETTDPYPVYYTSAAADAVIKNIITNPPTGYRITQAMEKGEGVDTMQVASSLGLSSEDQGAFDANLLKLVGTLPLSMRGSLRMKIDPSVLETLTQEGILDEKGVNFDRAKEVYNGENILQQIRKHFASGAADFHAFNALRDQYFELGHTLLPLQGLKLNGSGKPSGIDLAGYDFRDCDLSNGDFTFCHIGQAYIDGSTLLNEAKIDGSTVANPQQRELHLSQQSRTFGG